MRFFNTGGPVVAAKHYCIPPLARVKCAEVLGLIGAERYFIWPRGGGPPGCADRFVIECKVLRKSLERTVREGLEQTARYMDRCGCEAGHLVIFDRSEGKRWEDKLFRREESFRGRAVTVWGM